MMMLIQADGVDLLIAICIDTAKPKSPRVPRAGKRHSLTRPAFCL